MKKTSKRLMTMDKLAGMVAGGFASVDKKFENIEQRMVTKEEFRVLERKVDKIDFRVDELHDILARFEEGDILDLQKRVKILERMIRAIGSKL